MDPQNPSFLSIGGTFDHGRYRVERCIAQGGMGAVYEVQHLETRRKRALKVMLPAVVADPDMRARFRREATVAAEIESEHIAEVLDAGVDETTGAPFIVMELLKGQELAGLVANHGPRPPAEVVVYLWQAALALDKAHAIGVIHRDLKPENLFVTYRDDGAPRVKLLDFGIAKVLEGDKDVKATRGVLGTPLYISPEQIAAPQTIGPATDAYALAHIAYTLLVGEPYWRVEEQQAETVIQLLMRMVGGEPPEPPCQRARTRMNIELPPGFDAWFARATADQPHDRFPGVLATVRALAEALEVPLPAHGQAAISGQIFGIPGATTGGSGASGSAGASGPARASGATGSNTGPLRASQTPQRGATIPGGPAALARTSAPTVAGGVATHAAVATTVTPPQRSKRTGLALVLVAFGLGGGAAAAYFVLSSQTGRASGDQVASANAQVNASGTGTAQPAPSLASPRASASVSGPAPAGTASVASAASATASASESASVAVAPSTATPHVGVGQTPVTTTKPVVPPPKSASAKPACTLVVCDR